MLCVYPVRMRPGVEYPCGKCLCCRINRSRVWTARIVLEACSHVGKPTSFFTLTYQAMPVGGSLVPKDLEEFRYRLRYQIGAFRYYFVGEYGERRQRPHYHGLVFGHLINEDILARCWPHGIVDVSPMGVNAGAYVAGYISKKMYQLGAFKLKGRHPEFSRMSRKPGLGSAGLAGIIRWLYSSEGAAYIQEHHDVPTSIRFNGKIYPLGRYLVTALRDEFGIASSDPVRSMRAEAVRLERCLPEVIEARNFKREGHYQRAQFYLNLRRTKEKV